MLAGLLLSSYATGWMGLKYIFGAFLFGVVMSREGAAAALREEILDRLEQLSVLVLLPVFFVVSGLSVNLLSVGLSGLTELCLILLVAVVGKFGGAFIGASLAGIRARRAGVLATLMNTRGLTGIVILSVGLQLRILDQSLYSLMIVMAIVTTMMAGPLLHLIYPDRFVVADIAEADRAALGTAAGQRILVLIEAPETAAPLVDIGAALAASREHSQLILCHLLAREHDTRSEVATGLGASCGKRPGPRETFRRWLTGRRLAGCQRSCGPGSARTSPPNCPGMWRLPSLTSSCWARAEPSARRSQPTGQSRSSRSCAACRKRPARWRPCGREGRAGQPSFWSPRNWRSRTG